MSIKKLLGNQAHWNLNKDLVRKLGLTETLVLQQIIDLNYIFNRKEIFQSIGDMATELGIAEYSIKTSIKKLKDLGLINVERKSVGYRNFYSINEEKIKQLFNNESYEEFVEMQKLTDNSSTTLNVRLGTETVSFNSELKNDMSELNTTLGKVNTTIGEVNTIVGELKTNSHIVENISTITNNTTNNTLVKNIDKKYTANSYAGINFKSILDIIIKENNEKCADNIHFVDTEIGWDNFMDNFPEYDTSARNNFMNKIQNNALIYGIELNFNK
jgi:DNA-binding MarR family transcriptional regulator